jgi:hypothetical protein
MSLSLTNLQKAHLYFKEFESPEIFITWDVLYAVSSCLGRKIWCQGDNPIFPNIFVVIVGPPSVGKSQPAKQLFTLLSGMSKQDTKGNVHDLVNITPSCITLEKLYDFLEKCGDAVRLKPDAPPYFHSSASFLLADEMGLLFKKSDKTKDTILFLNTGYDNTDKFRYETKTKGINVVTNLCVNFFGCCTDRWISDNLSSNVIDEGFASRCFFVYGDEKRHYTTFYKFDDEQKTAWSDLKEHFKKIADLVGEVHLSPEAHDYLHEWYQKTEAGRKFRVNNDSKLDHYYGRKKLHAIKVATLYHYLEKTDNVITLDELKWAFSFLAHTEVNMHKALASLNSNPTAKLADDMKRELKAEGPMSKPELLAKFFGRSPGGLAMFDEALNFLRDTLQTRIGKDGKYELIEKVVAVDFKKPLVEKTTAEIKEEIRKASEA